MSSFLNDSFKNSSGLYERDISTSPLNTKKHSIINIEDQRAGAKTGKATSLVATESILNPKARSISHKRDITKSKLPSLQQGSSKKINNKSSIDGSSYKNNFSTLKAKSNIRPRQASNFESSHRDKQSSALKGTQIMINKVDSKENLTSAKASIKK